MSLTRSPHRNGQHPAVSYCLSSPLFKKLGYEETDAYLQAGLKASVMVQTYAQVTQERIQAFEGDPLICRRW